MRKARFFFDFHSEGVLWMPCPVAIGEMPIGQELRDELQRLNDLFDTSLNWEYPPDPGPWRQPVCDQFNAAVREALARLRDELGPGWHISDQFTELHEDPDLDRYLADPKGFLR